MVALGSDCGALQLPATTQHFSENSAQLGQLLDADFAIAKHASAGITVKNTFIDLDDEEAGECTRRVHPSGAATWCVGRFASSLRAHATQAQETPVTPITAVVQGFLPVASAAPQATQACDASTPPSQVFPAGLHSTVEDDSEDSKEVACSDDEGFAVVQSESTPSTSKSTRQTYDFISGSGSSMNCTVTSAGDTYRFLSSVSSASPFQNSSAGASFATRADSGMMQAHEFTVIFDTSRGEPMGIDVDHRNTSSLLVCNIFGGCVQAWNSQHPDLEVKVGDHIVEVNGVSGHPCGLINECWKNQLLHVKILRRAPALGFVSPCKSIRTVGMSAPRQGTRDETEVCMAAADRLASKSSIANGALGRRTMVCSHWKRTGWCRYNEACRFAHPAEKRGPLAPSSSDASGERTSTAIVVDAAFRPGTGSKPLSLTAPVGAPQRLGVSSARLVCRHWKSRGLCRYQGSCRFAHPEYNRGPEVMAMASAYSDPAVSASPAFCAMLNGA